MWNWWKETILINNSGYRYFGKVFSIQFFSGFFILFNSMKHIFPIFATNYIPFNSPFAHCAAHTIFPIFPMKYPWAKGESKEWSLPWRGAAAASLLPKANFSRANAKGNVATQQQQVLDHKIGLLLLVYRVLSLQSDYSSLQQCKTIIHLQPFSPFFMPAPGPLLPLKLPTQKT